jgi:hypothetical protein
MRIAEGLVFVLLSGVVITEGTYILKTRRQVETLTSELHQLRVEQDEAGIAGGYEPRRSGLAFPGQTATAAGKPAAPGQVPIPRFTPPPAGGTAPMPVLVAPVAPEVREQLRGIIAEELERERDDRRNRDRQDRDQERQKRTEEMIKKLGLNAEQGKKFTEVLASQEAARQAMRDKFESGQLQRGDIGREFQAIRQKNDQELRAVLGDDGMKKLQELEPERGRFGGGFGGGRRGGPGQPGQPAGAPTAP